MERVFRDLKTAAIEIKRDSRNRQRRVLAAVKKAARQTRNFIIKQTVPKAFGELIGSIHVEDESPGNSSVVADAPHAAAVEVGSRPHMPPLEPLIQWVKLRGMQGLTATGRMKSYRKADVLTSAQSTNRSSSQAIAQSLRSRLGKGTKGWVERANLGALAERELGADPATVALARSIQMAIAKKGTKPHRYMQQAVDQAREYLEQFVRAALSDRASQEAEEAKYASAVARTVAATAMKKARAARKAAKEAAAAATSSDED